jgi:CBS domain-containing protein
LPRLHRSNIVSARSQEIKVFSDKVVALQSGRRRSVARGLQSRALAVDSAQAFIQLYPLLRMAIGSERRSPVAKVRDILNVKGRDVWSIEPDASVYDAMRLMADKGVGALLVMEGEKLAGIISERDYARKVILQGRSSRTTQVSEIMTSRVAYAELDQNIEECMAVITEERVRHLPVIEAGRVVGVISIGDLVKSIIDEQKFMIEQLVRYING